MSSLLVALLDADQLVFEPGDEAARTDHDGHVLAGAAVERDAVDLADEVDHDLVAVRGLMALGGVVEARLRAGKLGDLRVDRGIVGLDRQALELDARRSPGSGTSGRVSSVTRTSASLPAA